MLLRKLSIVLFTTALGSLAGAGHHTGHHMDKNAKTSSYGKSYTQSKQTVLKVQKALNRNGYSVDEDGIMGTKTSNALHEYQLENGLQPNHRLDHATLVSLGIENSRNQAMRNSSTRRPASVENDKEMNIFMIEEITPASSSMYRTRSFNTITAGFGIPESSLEQDRPSSRTSTMIR